MPANYSRVDVHFSRRTRERLVKLKQEVKLRTGRSVSLSKIVDEIVAEYFDREELSCNSKR